jgi:hypothetical protein
MNKQINKKTRKNNPKLFIELLKEENIKISNRLVRLDLKIKNNELDLHQEINEFNLNTYFLGREVNAIDFRVDTHIEKIINFHTDIHFQVSTFQYIILKRKKYIEKKYKLIKKIKKNKDLIKSVTEITND